MTFSELHLAAKKRWFIVTFFTSVSTAAAILYALVAPREYRVESILAPANSSNSASDQLLSKLVALAALAGLPRIDNEDRTQQAVTILRSRAFLREFVERHSLLPEIFPNDWDEQRTTWGVDPAPTT